MRLATGAILALVALCAACSSRGPDGSSASLPSGNYKVGRPYQINGQWYYPEYDPAYSKVGTASWYGDAFHGKPTANGEVFDKSRITAAHPTLPLPSIVKVTNLENGRELTLRVNDRGPFVNDRLIDLSEAAAAELGYQKRGLAKVRVEFLELAPARGTRPEPTTVNAARTAPSAPAAAPVIARDGYAGPAIPGGRSVQMASIEPAPQPARAASGCVTSGPQWVQVGAYTETTKLHLAANSLDEIASLRIEPVMIGGQAAIRLRLGPAADRNAAIGMLDQVRARGFDDAYLVPVEPGSAQRRC